MILTVEDLCAGYGESMILNGVSLSVDRSGRLQMLALGSSLMLDPSILLLDEPSVGLAPKFQDMIFERIRELKSTGVSILLVEQNVHRAMEVTDRGYVLEMGKVSLQGTSKELLS